MTLFDNSLLSNLTTQELTAVQEALAILIKHKQSETESKIELYASTVEVNIITRQVYDWKLLRRWCIENSIAIPKTNIYGLELNEYPDIAWQSVYGLDIAQLFPNRTVN